VLAAIPIELFYSNFLQHSMHPELSEIHINPYMKSAVKLATILLLAE
jgi:hypothetical protein